MVGLWVQIEPFAEQEALNIPFVIGKVNFVAGKEWLAAHISGKLE
jgi:hypothetical protein